MRLGCCHRGPRCAAFVPRWRPQERKLERCASLVSRAWPRARFTRTPPAWPVTRRLLTMASRTARRSSTRRRMPGRARARGPGAATATATRSSTRSTTARPSPTPTSATGTPTTTATRATTARTWRARPIPMPMATASAMRAIRVRRPPGMRSSCGTASTTPPASRGGPTAGPEERAPGRSPAARSCRARRTRTSSPRCTRRRATSTCTSRRAPSWARGTRWRRSACATAGTARTSTAATSTR